MLSLVKSSLHRWLQFERGLFAGGKVSVELGIFTDDSWRTFMVLLMAPLDITFAIKTVSELARVNVYTF
jgi:hypothetical protein